MAKKGNTNLDNGVVHLILPARRTLVCRAVSKGNRCLYEMRFLETPLPERCQACDRKLTQIDRTRELACNYVTRKLGKKEGKKRTQKGEIGREIQSRARSSVFHLN